ncbi:hypothetical protein PHMEG_00016897 [Phytophthora megakarya]|uniref:PX domain-containing protein n=1 Tax=Phytophthora megakarya TaxID=4795 RepID=A0A225VXW9_9STRA|nr:hypothetical protein PHMEG_00016897 [Phytophthora megakarya]
MGCSQSKVNDIVVESVTAPPSECGKASMDIAFTEIIVEHEETSTSVPPALVKEEIKEDLEEEEIVAEEEPIEQPVEVEAVDEPLTDEETIAVEPVAVEETVAHSAIESIEEESPVESEVEAEEEAEQEKYVVEKSAVTSVNAPVWTFVADKVSFTIGVAFFCIAGSNSDGEEVYLTKRYSEFKVLHAEMAKIMTKEELPGMPGTSFLQGRNDKALLQERETMFVKMLNAIAQHHEGSQSTPFVAFLA